MGLASGPATASRGRVPAAGAGTGAAKKGGGGGPGACAEGDDEPHEPEAVDARIRTAPAVKREAGAPCRTSAPHRSRWPWFMHCRLPRLGDVVKPSRGWAVN